MIPTTQVNIDRINAFCNRAEKLVVQLADRWADEKDHEDIADYATPIRTIMPEGFTLTKMTKRPFGFEFNIGTDARYSIYVSGNKYGWKRIG